MSYYGGDYDGQEDFADSELQRRVAAARAMRAELSELRRMERERVERVARNSPARKEESCD